MFLSNKDNLQLYDDQRKSQEAWVENKKNYCKLEDVGTGNSVHHRMLTSSCTNLIATDITLWKELTETKYLFF